MKTEAERDAFNEKFEDEYVWNYQHLYDNKSVIVDGTYSLDQLKEIVKSLEEYFSEN